MRTETQPPRRARGNASGGEVQPGIAVLFFEREAGDHRAAHAPIAPALCSPLGSSATVPSAAMTSDLKPVSRQSKLLTRPQRARFQPSGRSAGDLWAVLEGKGSLNCEK